MSRQQKPKQNLMPILAIAGMILIAIGIYGVIQKDNVSSPVPALVSAPVPAEPVYDGVVQDNPEVRQWTEGALPSIQTFNYTTIPLVKDQQRNFFTEAGLKSFNQAMASSRIYESVIAQKKKSKLRIVCPAQVVRSGNLNGTRVWDVITVGEIDYSAGDQHNVSLLGYSVLIQDLGTPEKPYGIDQIIGIPLRSDAPSCASLFEQILSVKRSASDFHR